MNKVLLVGNVGATPVAKRTKDGKSVCSFSVATPRAATKTGDGKECDWHSIAVFGKQADVCHTALRTGSKVLVDGALTSSSYTSKLGEKRTTVKVVAYSVTFLDPKEKSASGAKSRQAQAPAEEEAAEFSF
jgi:single-strand DNA-binding protein